MMDPVKTRGEEGRPAEADTPEAFSSRSGVSLQSPATPAGAESRKPGRNLDTPPIPPPPPHLDDYQSVVGGADLDELRFLAQQLKRHGHRVLVHDFAANPANAPALHEFECLSDLAELRKRSEVKLAVICCPWAQYQGLALGPNTQIFTPWQL